MCPENLQHQYLTKIYNKQYKEYQGVCVCPTRYFVLLIGVVRLIMFVIFAFHTYDIEELLFKVIIAIKLYVIDVLQR